MVPVCLGLVSSFAVLTVTVARCGDAPARPTATTTKNRLQTEARGFYLLWAQGRPDADQILDLPFVRGGQVVVQWADVEPNPGQYDFSRIDTELARLAVRGKWTTLQVNGNRKPAWLFTQVPFVDRALSAGVRDRRTLMFWHPRFQDAHIGMLTALARHLRASPHRKGLLGLRLNFNAIGTEHFELPTELTTPDRWIVPDGVERATLVPFTPDVREAYVARVVSAYDRLFADWVTVFVRNNISDALRRQYAGELARGRLALFHTSSEAEPRSAGTERQYGAFFDLCRSGQTLGYAEPWASAWGEHSGLVDPRWCSPEQWNYWTLLLDLHCGVSFIGDFYENLRFAISGRHGRDAPVDPQSAGPREFMAAYEWAGEYVGRHDRPAESPGAWVAFRENRVVKAANPRVTGASRHLERFTGDYSWLAERVGDDGSVGVGPVGPANQRFGAFARRYASGQVARVRIAPGFLRSLNGDVSVRVIVMGKAAAQLKIGARICTLPASPRRWNVFEFAAAADELQGAPGDGQIEIHAGSTPIILHMVEVRRTAGGLQ